MDRGRQRGKTYLFALRALFALPRRGVLVLPARTLVLPVDGPEGARAVSRNKHRHAARVGSAHSLARSRFISSVISKVRAPSEPAIPEKRKDYQAEQPEHRAVESHPPILSLADLDLFRAGRSPSSSPRCKNSDAPSSALLGLSGSACMQIAHGPYGSGGWCLGPRSRGLWRHTPRAWRTS
jgi:hypothetical protein